MEGGGGLRVLELAPAACACEIQRIGGSQSIGVCLKSRSIEVLHEVHIIRLSMTSESFRVYFPSYSS